VSLAVKTARAASQGGLAGPVSSGDPGLFGFLKGVVRTGVSLVTGGPVAAGATAVRSIRGRPRGPVSMPAMPQVPAPGALGALQRFFPGGETGMVAAGAACPSGFHANKTDYFLIDGTHVPRGSRCVKNRRRNPLNPRAASRAISRIVSAKKATAALGRITVRAKVPHHHHKKK